MRRVRLPALLFLLVAVPSSLVPFAACSGTSTATTPSDAGADGADAPFGVAVPHDAGNGCFIVGPLTAATAQSLPRAGVSQAASWTNLDEARAKDTETAQAALGPAPGAPATSEELRVTDFGFAIPTNVKVQGVSVALSRQATGPVLDGVVSLIVGGQPAPTTHDFLPDWPVSGEGTHVYGGDMDTWGADLTPAQINDPGLGASVWVQLDTADAATTSATAMVDALQISVTYCP